MSGQIPGTRPEGATNISALEARPAPVGGSDCLVAIYSSDASQFGKRYLLKQDALTIGRGAENVVVINNDSASRRHCRIERRGTHWYVVDLESTNGTYVNDELVKEHCLRRGDHVKVGDTILKYLSGSDIEAQYHETVYRMTIVDGLTDVHNKRFVLETLERELPRSRRHAIPLAVFMLDLDHFKKLNDTYGHLAGDYVLKEVATLVKRRLRPDDVLGRYGGEEFCAVLPQTPVGGAVVYAEDLRKRIAAHRFVFEAETIPVTASFGCAELGAEMDASGLVQAAEEALERAKRDGRNRVSAPVAGGRPHRRWLSEIALLHRALASEKMEALVAFEIGDEGAILAERGISGWEAEKGQLERVVEDAAPADDHLGRWQSRYVLVATASAKELRSAVEEQWAAAHADADGTVTAPRLRTASLTRHEAVELGERSLDQLIARLLRRDDAPTTGTSPRAALPFPLVGPEVLANAGASSSLRVKGFAHAVEAQLRFAVAVGFGLVDADRAAPELLELITECTRRAVPMGKWLQLARLFAESIPVATDHPAATWLRGLLGSKAKRGRAPLSTLQTLVGRRNELVGHGAPLPDDAYADGEREFRTAFAELTDRAAPLATTSLVSVAASEVLEDESGFAYDLRIHSGPAELFPIQRQMLPHRMTKGFAYLLCGESAPVSLAPIVFSTTCPECRRVELMLADSLVLGPKEATVDGSGVTTDHRAKITAPASARYRAYHQAVVERGGARSDEPKTVILAPSGATTLRRKVDDSSGT